MNKLAFLIIFLTFLNAYSANNESVMSLERPTSLLISSGLIYETMGTENLMVQAGLAYKINTISALGVRGLISTSNSVGANNDSSIQLFYNNKNWDINLGHNTTAAAKFISAGVAYDVLLARAKQFRLDSVLGIDFIQSGIPSDLALRLGLFSLSPRLGVNATFDL